MNRYAVVDLEATDASLGPIKIIQIGIVIVEDGEVLSQFASEVQPGQKLSRSISELTGLTDADLLEAPTFDQIASEVETLLEGTVFVAHNVKFDYSLLSTALKSCGIALQLPRVDTVELARIFFPTLARYGLEALVTELDLVNDHPHQAVSDALATAQLLTKIQKKIEHLPRAVVSEILRHSGQLIFETRLIIEESGMRSPEQVTGLSIRGNMATQTWKIPSLTRDLFPSLADNLRVLGLVPRPAQQILADMIQADLSNGIPAFIEAQAGIGKTYGYLLPLLTAGRKIILSTSTKILQRQLMEDYGPILREKFGVSSSKLVGRANYVSLSKLDLILQKIDSSKNFEIFKMKVLVWLSETETGELTELSGIMTSPLFAEAISHDGKVKPDDFHGDQDFWLKAKKEAGLADIVVVNHAYLIKRLVDDPTFLEGRVLLVDETQELFSALESSQQEALEIINQILEIKIYESKVRRRTVESLLFQLGQSPLDREKILTDGGELGLSDLTQFFADPDKIYWTQGNTLKSSPGDFYNFRALLPVGVKVFLVGAGLEFSEKAPILPDLLGFDTYNFYKQASILNPNQKCLVARTGPLVNNVSIQVYSKYVADCLSGLVELSYPIIVLFTSQLMLDWTSRFLRQAKVNFQDQNQKIRPEQIKKWLDNGRTNLILGTGAFWEGVDFDKQDKLILVIPRIPFASPDDILTKKYAERFDNAFYDFNLPMATLKMRQAFGRVSRRLDQKSMVLVLDQRLSGRSYAETIRKNLAQIANISSSSLDGALGQISDFLDS